MEKDFERTVIERLTIIETKLDNYNKTEDKANEAHTLSKENRKDIDEINDKIKWLSRAIAAALISGIVGLVFAILKIGMGV